jgi:hypothetical protein
MCNRWAPYSASFTVSRRRARIKPIFVDNTGKRRRMFTMIAAVAGVLLTTAVVMLLAGFVGAGPSQLPGLPDLHPVQQEVARVPGTPAPAGEGVGPTGAATTTTGPTHPAPLSTVDTRGNKPTHTPAHPQPTRTR